MNGVLLGVLLALALLALLRGLRVLAWRRGRHGAPGRRLLARRLLRRLDATPEQERLFLAELDALREAMREAREGLSASRDELARALEADALDRAALDALGARQVERVEAVRRLASDGLARIHAALDAGQRRRLAELLRARRPACAAR